MALVVVPSAKPYNVLGCCWNIAQRASLDLVALPVVYGCLVPGLEVLALNAGNFFVGLSSNSPIKSAGQVLTVLSGREPVGTLLLGFVAKCGFNCVPLVSEVEVGF